MPVQPERGTETTPDALTDRFGLVGYASQRHPTQLASPGDFSLIRMREGAHWNHHRMVVMDAEGERRSFAVVRHPMLAGWMVLEMQSRVTTGFMKLDLFDAIWACRPWAGYATMDFAIAVTLYRYGYIAPTTSNSGSLMRARRSVANADEFFGRLFSDESDLGTEACTGCEQCGGEKFHRVDSE